MTYHIYVFLQASKKIYQLSSVQRTKLHKAFIQELNKQKDVLVYSYTTVGLKANTSLLLWMQSESLEILQNVLNNLMHTKLGEYIDITYTLFGLTRPSQYSATTPTVADTRRKGGKYLIIYPFSKTQEWYFLSFEKRKELMKGHMTTGRKYPQITQLLLYSYGVDDNEFIVSYETDTLSEFQQLVIDLRADGTRAYTLKDTPIFTCIYRPIEEAVSFL